jgi:hypothetical protein
MECLRNGARVEVESVGSMLEVKRYELRGSELVNNGSVVYRSGGRLKNGFTTRTEKAQSRPRLPHKYANRKWTGKESHSFLTLNEAGRGNICHYMDVSVRRYDAGTLHAKVSKKGKRKGQTLV